MLVSVELVKAASAAPRRPAPERRRPIAARPAGPVVGRLEPTILRPAFDPEAVDPADLERASRQSTIAPGEAGEAGEIEAPALRPEKMSRRKKGPDEDLVVVSPSETDWMHHRAEPPARTSRGGLERAERSGPWNSRRSRISRRWVWLIGATGGAAAATVLVVALSSPEPEVLVAPPIVVAVPEAVEREEAQAPGASAKGQALEPVEAPEAEAAPAAGSSPAAATPEVGESAMATTEPAVSQVPVWVQALTAQNPWVEVAPAPAGTRLGLAEARPGATGFTPEDAVFAPTYAYRIQQHEVSWEELGKFIFATQRDVPVAPRWSPEDAEVRAAMPATQVPWELADAYCQAIGGELPSEAEWEWAARGPTLATHPWGEALPYADRVRFRRGVPVALAQVGTMVQDVTPGAKPIHDLMGNAAEWTRDVWPGEGELRAVRGWPLGRSGDPLPREGLTYRRAGCAGEGCVARADFDLIGFRCVMR